MNSIYRSIWNEKTGTFVAVCENAKSAGKRSRAGAGAQGGSLCVCLKGLSIALALGFGMQVYASPTGGAVTAGSASISTGAGTTLVTQTTANAVINWQSFNIGLGETVRFVQPSSNAVALNRVLGPDPSTILGNLTANGKVFLMNPNGVLFGKGAQVNVGGLVASTLDLADSDFMAGRYHFSNAGAGTVRNQGSINADGGYVALLGANVSNEGTISAQLGTVALVGATALTLDVAGDGLLNVTLNAGAVNALVQNGGMIRADGGQVVLSAQAAGALLQSVVNNTGVIQAQTLDNRNGRIRLLGDMQSGTVNVGGTLDVSGGGAGQTAGSVTATGHHVGLFGARINASGDAGGGTVLVGGDYQGKNPSVQNAAATYMSADSQITADAITNGNGGKVVLWADDSTRAYGGIAAQGGAQGGNGGLIETSAHHLDVAGIQVAAGSPHGVSGQWLLDPADVTIGTGTVGGSFVGSVFSANSGVAAANVDAGDIQTALNGGSDVTITTTNNGVSGVGAGNITVNSALTWTTGQTLTLNAASDVTVSGGSAITASTSGSKIVLTAGSNVNVNAALTASASGSQILLSAGSNVNINGALTASASGTKITVSAGSNVQATAAVTATGGGAMIDMGAGNNVSVVAVTSDGGGSVNLHANKDVMVGGAISATGGSVMLRADSDGTGPGAAAGTVQFSGPGSVAASSNTTIRFNPNGYANTATEIASYVAVVTGALDAKAWVFPVGVDRPYNGLTTATLDFKNPLPADNPHVGNLVTLAGGTATFNTKDVGTSKAITYNGYTLGGGDLARFAIYSAVGVASGNGTTTANITAIPLSVTANDHSPKIYGSTVTFTGTEYTSTGLVNAETVGTVTLVSAGAAPGAPVAVYAITPSGATANGPFLPSNYTITYINGTLPVTQAPLTIKANDANKTGGDTFTPTGTAFTTPVAPQNGETVGSVTITSPGATTTATAGTYALTPSSATGGTFTPSNYAITYTPGALTVTGTAAVAPPVVVPPAVVPPGVVPPVVVPPVVVPPVVVPPVTPPLVVPPGETPPDEPPPFEVPTITTPHAPVPPVTVFTAPLPPPVSLVVTPVPVPPTMAPPQVFVAPPPLAPPLVKEEVPPEVVPQPYVPPRHPRKQDRN